MHGTLDLWVIGRVRSPIRTRGAAPMQGAEGPLEAIDGTPVVDLKADLRPSG